jgi:hypothetical protein
MRGKLKLSIRLAVCHNQGWPGPGLQSCNIQNERDDHFRRLEQDRHGNTSLNLATGSSRRVQQVALIALGLPYLLCSKQRGTRKEGLARGLFLRSGS